MYVEARTGYEDSKLARERYAEYYANKYGMDMAGLRFFSVHQGMQGNEEHKDGFANIIAQFADSLANSESPVIYGDGTHTRDFTHLSDVVRAVEMAAEAGLTGIYNVGTGEQYSANEVVEMLNEALGTDIAPEHVENPIDEDVFVSDTLADASRLREAVGWEPQIGIEDGIQRVCSPYLTTSSQ